MDIDRALAPHAGALDFRAKRQQVLASNLANADTPGYKAVDLAFPQQMLRAQQAALPMAGSHAGHMNATGAGADKLLYRTPAKQSIDGNTVDAQQEMANFADNALRFDAALRGVSHEMKRIRGALE